MPLQKLQFRAGINREVTSYSNEGGWFDGDKIRFRLGAPEKIGGWEKISGEYFLGTCRNLKPWKALDGERFIGVGTSQKYYIEDGGAFFDITPIESTFVGDFTLGAKVPNTLSAGVTAEDVSIPLTATTGFPESGVVKINNEIIFYGEISSNNLSNCIRGFSGTTAASHSSSDAVSCATIKIVRTAHGLETGGFTTLSNAATLGGNVTALVLNQEYLIRSIIDEDNFLIDAREVATVSSITTEAGYTPTYVFANASDTGNGKNTFTNSTVDTASGDATCTMDDTTVLVVGAPISGTGIPASTTVLSITDATTFELSANATATGTNITATITTTALANQVPIGADTVVAGTGWGAGKWGRLTWGSASPITSAVESVLRTWSHDTFGENLYINPRGGDIYYWIKSTGVASRAVSLSDLSGSVNPPTIANQILVSNVERHVIAFGCDDQFNVGVQNPLLIRFSSQGDTSLDWNVTDTSNSAGSLTMGSGNEIVVAVETRNDTLVFTDISLYALQYLGDPYYFGLRLISENLTIAGQNAVINIDDTVYWMGAGEFYSYSGSVNRLICSVRSYVFNDFNASQKTKVIAAANSEFGEVWWFYPSADSQENNKYVAYNYEDAVWFYGDLPRTAWVDRSISDFPVAASTDNLLYYQEKGFDDGSTSPAAAINSFIESSQMSIGNGDDFAFIGRMIPDLTFENSTSTAPSADFTVKARNFPGGAYLQENDKAVTKTSTTPVEQFTNQVYMRLRGRSFAFKISSDETEMTWRLGTPRIDVRTDGRR